MLKLLLCNPFLFFPINLHNCCPSELKRSILSYAFQENLIPPALAFGVPVKNGKEQAVLKKRPMRATELVVLCVCNSTVQIGIWTSHRPFFFFVINWLFSHLRLQLRQCNKELRWSHSEKLLLLFLTNPDSGLSMGFLESLISLDPR